jgi:hypothetical protein
MEPRTSRMLPAGEGLVQSGGGLGAEKDPGGGAEADEDGGGAGDAEALGNGPIGEPLLAMEVDVERDLQPLAVQPHAVGESDEHVDPRDVGVIFPEGAEDGAAQCDLPSRPAGECRRLVRPCRERPVGRSAEPQCERPSQRLQLAPPPLVRGQADRLRPFRKQLEGTEA